MLRLWPKTRRSTSSWFQISATSNQRKKSANWGNAKFRSYYKSRMRTTATSKGMENDPWCTVIPLSFKKSTPRSDPADQRWPRPELMQPMSWFPNIRCYRSDFPASLIYQRLMETCCGYGLAWFTPSLWDFQGPGRAHRMPLPSEEQLSIFKDQFLMGNGM